MKITRYYALSKNRGIINPSEFKILEVNENVFYLYHKEMNQGGIEINIVPKDWDTNVPAEMSFSIMGCNIPYISVEEYSEDDFELPENKWKRLLETCVVIYEAICKKYPYPLIHPNFYEFYQV